MANERNARFLHNYISHLSVAKGQSNKSIDAAMRAISEFEVFSNNRDFRDAHPKGVQAFRDHLLGRSAVGKEQPLSASTITHAMRHCRSFFAWLVNQPGARNMDPTVVDYFTPPRRIQMLARSPIKRPVPSLAEIRKIIASCPVATLVERRDRAVIAFCLISGMRDDAIASTRIQRVDVIAARIRQEAIDMRVKFSKSQWVTWYPIAPEAEDIVTAWMGELNQLGFGPDDPVFPKNRLLESAQGHFSPSKLDRSCWANADPIRKIFKTACERAGLPYFNPHSVRHMHGRILAQYPPELRKACSQNLGHEHVRTTEESYGHMDDDRVHELIRGARGLQDATTKTEMHRELAEEIHRLDEDHAAALLRILRRK